jgi:hypothetical protein
MALCVAVNLWLGFLPFLSLAGEIFLVLLDILSIDNCYKGLNLLL